MMYVVLSPLISTVVPVCDDGTGPVEVGRDAYLVDAANAHDARWDAYRLAERRGDAWPALNRGDGLHPLHGCTVEPPLSPEDADPAAWPGRFVDAMVRSA